MTWRPFQPGDDPLEPRYMTPEQRDEMVARARAAQDDKKRRAAVARWEPANRILSDEAVVAIREARAAGTSLRSIAAAHKITVATVSRIARGQSRKSAGGPVQRGPMYAARRSANASAR